MDTFELFVVKGSEQGLAYRLEGKELVIGYDHGFGKGRAGNVELLRVLGEQMGFAVDVVSEVDYDSRPVSSTRVRRAVAGGGDQRIRLVELRAEHHRLAHIERSE